MGIDLNTVRFLAWARTRGVSYRCTAMLGRQQYMGITTSKLDQFLARSGQGGNASARSLLHDAAGYAEPLFGFLGSETLHSYDASDYENATHRWDLNEAPPTESLGSYSVVFDGGTLEHVFDFPKALQGALSLLEPGGHYIAVTPAHGWFGHGFYQFSAELFQQLFRPCNGCELTALLLFEDRGEAPFYEVLSPERSGGRHKFASLRPASLAVIARRISAVPERLRLQQSDYVATWASAQDAAPLSADPSRPHSDIPASVRIKAGLRRWLKARYLALGGNPFFDDRIYRKVEI